MFGASLNFQTSDRASRPSVRPQEAAAAAPGQHSRCEFFKAVSDGALDQVARMAAGDPTLLRETTVSGLTPLGLAAFLGHIDVMDFLLDLGTPVDFSPQYSGGQTPLSCAVMRGQIGIARYLLERGADINNRQAGDFTPLHAAAQTGDVEMLRLLLAFHPDVNARHAEGGTALSIALEWGHGEAANLLRQHGAV